MSDTGSTWVLPSIDSSGNGYPTVTITRSFFSSLPSSSISLVIRVPWRH